MNATGSFFADGGAAAAKGYANKTGTASMTAGTWQIRAGKNAFGGVMGLLGKYGETGWYIVTGKWGSYQGTSSWNMVKAIGRSAADPANPYSKTAMWYKSDPKGQVATLTILAVGSGTPWTTGQIGNFAKVGFYYTSLWRTGYDNRTPGGAGAIQLVTPTLTHWLSLENDTHTAQIGILKIRVPEPGALLLLAAGSGALLALRCWTGQSKSCNG